MEPATPVDMSFINDRTVEGIFLFIDLFWGGGGLKVIIIISFLFIVLIFIQIVLFTYIKHKNQNETFVEEKVLILFN